MGPSASLHRFSRLLPAWGGSSGVRGASGFVRGVSGPSSQARPPSGVCQRGAVAVTASKGLSRQSQPFGRGFRGTAAAVRMAAPHAARPPAAASSPVSRLLLTYLLPLVATFQASDSLLLASLLGCFWWALGGFGGAPGARLALRPPGGSLPASFPFAEARLALGVEARCVAVGCGCVVAAVGEAGLFEARLRPCVGPGLGGPGALGALAVGGRFPTGYPACAGVARASWSRLLGLRRWAAGGLSV